MPFIDLDTSPLAPGVSPVRIHYRAAGSGAPIVCLHSGWGYEIYPFDRQIAALAPGSRIVCPNRSGYGASTWIDTLSPDFHVRAADETRRVIAALRLERPVLWGHSDGAIIALLLALDTPELVRGVIAEATHFYRRKPHSRAFFESMIGDGRALGDTVKAVLTRDHGGRWPQLIERHSRAWRRIADEAVSDSDDFYGGRLGDISVPVLVLHGARDPRTEPGEMEALADTLGPAKAGPHVLILPDGGHSPHSEAATADEVTHTARTFVEGLGA